MVGLTVLLLVVAVVNLVRGDDSGSSRPTVSQAAAEPTPSTSTGAAPDDEPTTGTGTGKKKRKQKQQAATEAPEEEPVVTPPPPPAEPDGPCASSDVLVTPVIGSVIAGRPVLVTLELRTQESEACTWTLDRRTLAYAITTPDGGNVWSSADCPGQVPSDTIVVRRAQTSTYRLAWAARVSSYDCPTQGHVEPGDYEVQASAIGGEPSAVVPFTLVDPDDVVTSDEPAGPTTSTDGGKKKQKQGGKKGKKGKPETGSGEGEGEATADAPGRT